MQLIKGAIKVCLEQWADGIESRPAVGSPAKLGSKIIYSSYPSNQSDNGAKPYLLVIIEDIVRSLCLSHSQPAKLVLPMQGAI